MPKCLECNSILPRLQWTHFKYKCTGKFKNGREYRKVYPDAELVDSNIAKKTAITLENLTKKYGKLDGVTRWNEYKQKQAYSNSFVYKKKKHNWTKKKWKDFNNSRAITIENLIKKYGEEQGLINWNNYCDKQRVTKSKEYVVNKYGIEKWNHICKLKKQVHDPHWISNNERITIDEAIAKIAARRGTAYTSKIELEFISMLEKYQALDHTTKKNPFGKWDHLNNRYVIYDIKHKNCIIEFNGDYWHANPTIYNKNDIIRTKSAAEIWERDRHKLSIVESIGLSTYVIWESDFIKNKQATINKVVKWIQNTLKLNQSNV